MGSGMLYPASKDPFNRYLSSIGEQELKYSREGANAWRDEFMHVTKRDKPELANAAWFGDHFLGDVLLIFGYDKNKRPILKRPWHTCNLDAASSALVGSVVCAIPNSMTIAECFCRSVAFTVDSPFFSCPEVYYVAEQTKANINRIINGPINNAFENYYAAKGKSISDKEN